MSICLYSHSLRFAESCSARRKLLIWPECVAALRERRTWVQSLEGPDRRIVTAREVGLADAKGKAADGFIAGRIAEQGDCGSTRYDMPSHQEQNRSDLQQARRSKPYRFAQVSSEDSADVRKRFHGTTRIAKCSRLISRRSIIPARPARLYLCHLPRIWSARSLSLNRHMIIVIL